jgi:Spy/CpxP family protein refolding chaperone
MKTRATMTLAILLFTLNNVVTTAVHAGDEFEDERRLRMHAGAGMHEYGDPERMVKRLSRKLDLDQAQLQQIGNVVSAAQPEIDALRDRVDANRKALHELDVNDGNHDTRLGVLATEKGAIATEQTLLHGRLKSEINAVLTPEQRQELAASAGKMQDRFRKRREGRSGG